MAKKMYSFWRLLLGSLITLLGFGACKTAKKVQQEKVPPVLYGAPPPELIERQEQPVDKVRILYGVPPVRIERVEE